MTRQEITRQVVSAFEKDPTLYDGHIARLIALDPSSPLPMGLDDTDEKVKEIVRKCLNRWKPPVPPSA